MSPLISAVLLIVSTVLISVTCVALQRQEVARRGNTTRPGQTTISAAGPALGGTGRLGGRSAPPPPPPVEVGEAKSIASRGAMIAAATAKTDFSGMAPEPPVLHNMSTYLHGDNLYDESYSLETKTGDFLGECGVSIAESVDLDGQKNVVAFELWVFDASDPTKTSAKELITEQAARTPSIVDKLSAKGEVVTAKAGEWLALDTSSVRVLVRIADVAARDAAPVPGAFFERLVLEVAAWKHTGQPLPEVPKSAAAQAAMVEAGVDGDAPAAPAEPGPEVVRQRVATSYLIEFARRAYLREPFKVRVTIPAEIAKAAASKAASARKGSAAPENVGQLSFEHRFYPQDQPPTEQSPQVGVALAYRNDDFHVPVSTMTGRLISTGGVDFEFLVRPLRAETLLMAVKFYAISKQWRDERELEELVNRDPKTREVVSITSRKAPAGFFDNAELLATETIRVQVRGLLNLTAAGLNGLARAFGALLIIVFILSVVGRGGLGDVMGIISLVVGVIGGALPLVAISMLLGGMNKETGGPAG